MKMRNYITISLVLGVTLAVLNCFADAFVFHGGSLADQFLRPTAVEIWMRSMLIAACLALGTHFQRMAGKRQEFEAALKRSCDELEQRVQKRTRELTEANRRLEQEVAERTQAEQALRLMQFAIEHSSDPIYWVKADGRIAYANQAACRALGYDAEELLSMSVPDFDPDFPHSAWPEHWERMKASGTATFEAHHRSKQGRVFPVEITTNYIEHEGQEYIWAYARDITERKRAKKSLCESEERFRSLFENAPLSYQSLDQAGCFLDVNDTWSSVMGYAKDEVIGRNFSDFLAKEYIEKFLYAFPCFQGAGEIRGIEFEMLKKDGSRIIMSFDGRIGRHPDGSFKRTHCILQDITERKQSERALRESEERFRRVVTNINDALIIDDEEGRIVYANDRFLDMFGFARQDIPSLRLDNYVAPQWRERLRGYHDRRVRGEEAPERYEYEGRRKDGGSLWLEVCVTQVMNSGKVVGTQSLIRDMTEHKRAEEELRLSAEIMEHMAEGINLIRVSDGAIVFTNRVFDEMFGYEPGELNGRHVAVLNAEGDKSPEQTAVEIFSGVETSGSWRGEILNAKKDGTEFWTRVHVSAFDHAKHGLVYVTVQEDITERKRAEEAIQEKEEQLDNLLSNVGVIVLEGDPFNIYYVGGQVERLLGYRREQWFEDPDGPVGFWSKHLHPDDEDKIELCRRAIESGRNHAFEYRMIAADGGEVWFYDTVTVETENGRPVKTRSVMVDITERKLAEEALRKAHEELEQRVEQRTAELVTVNQKLRDSEAHAQAVLISALHPIITIDDRGSVSSFNPAAERDFGYSEQEMLGRNVDELMPSPYRDEHDDYLARYLTTGEGRVIGLSREVVGRRKDGTTFPLEVSVGEARVGDRRLFVGVLQDITKRKQAEQALLESEERFRRAVVDAPVPIMIHAEDGEVLGVNTVWTDLTGYQQAEIPTIAEWTERAYGARQEAARERIDELYQIDGRVAEDDYTITTKDGRTLIWAFSSSPLGRMEDGRRLVISMAADVTEQRRAEARVHKQQEELAHMSRLSALGEMATSLAHELNQPLTSIVNYTSGCVRRIQAGRPDLQELVAVLNDASSEAQRAGEIIKRVRSFIQKREPVRATLNVSELIRQALDLMRHDLQRHGVQTRLEVEEHIPALQGDQIQLQQVLLNLLRNSVEAMSGTEMKHRRLTVGATTDNGDSVTLFVRDSGCGLGEVDPDSVFEPFYTTKEDGTGMGLAISRTIIEAHGGRLWATSNADGGCTFRFSLSQHSQA